jgi:hypothetical protein
MMLVDCQTCPVRDVHCADCMVTALAAVSAPTQLPTPTVVPRSLTTLSPGPVPHGPDIARDAPGEPDSVPLDRAERRAVSVLLAAGLVSLDTANGARAVRAAVSPRRAEPRRAEPRRAEPRRAEPRRAEPRRAAV